MCAFLRAIAFIEDITLLWASLDKIASCQGRGVGT